MKLISEKGTVRGVLAPVLDQYAVGFLPVGGFSSATKIYDLAEDDDGRPLILLYVGDYDPSGLYMSERDIPERLARYGGDHAKLRRIALRPEHLSGLTSFPATDKREDTRYKWFVANYGGLCWELDAMDPRELRDCVEREIRALIEPVAWERCELVNRAEQQSLKPFSKVGARRPAPAREEVSMSEETLLTAARRVVRFVRVDDVAHGGLLSRDLRVEHLGRPEASKAIKRDGELRITAESRFEGENHDTAHR